MEHNEHRMHMLENAAEFEGSTIGASDIERLAQKVELEESII